MGVGGGVRKYLANRHILPFYGPLPESVKFSEFRIQSNQRCIH